MGFYDRTVLPHLLNLVMKDRRLAAERRRFVPRAEGTVLEVGIGSGLNLPFYAPAVEKVIGIDPSAELRRMARKRAARTPFEVAFLGLSGEAIPLDDGAVDTVLSTWTLCTIPDADAALREMRRVLKADGRFIFIEHGRAPEARVRAWQDRINPYWRPLAGGCNLNRPIDAMIRAAGFHIAELEADYLKGPKPFSFHYKGLAKPE